jgi:hypothetical protein
VIFSKELFDYLGKPDLWEKILSWLKQWKDSLPEIPEVDFDKTPEESFEEIKELPIRYWRQLMENEKLWVEGIISVIFKKGDVLKLVLGFFDKQQGKPYKELVELLNEKLNKFY